VFDGHPVGAPDRVVSMMTIRFFALSAISALCCVYPALAGEAPLAVYYSFDTTPPAEVFTEMQSELGRILAPSGVHAAWRATDAPRDGREDFPEIVVFHFRGRCDLKGADGNSEPDPAGRTLAETKLVDGHILPFGAVDCDKVRAFIAPVLKSMPAGDQVAALGRALARVSAHEIYHMLTGTETHSRKGIFRPAHSRTDLTAATFSFAAPENNWLRAWLKAQSPSPSEPAVETAASGSVSASGDAGFTEPEPEPAAFAGR
jgi:hypothetical protein